MHRPKCVNIAQVFYMTDGERPEWRNSGGLYPAVLLPKGTVALLIISALCCWSSGCADCFQAQAQLRQYQKTIFSHSEWAWRSCSIISGPKQLPFASLYHQEQWGGESSPVLSYQSTAEENPITGMDIIISLIPVVRLKTGSTGQQIQTMVPFSITQMKVWLELMNKPFDLSQTKLHFKELKSCELPAWEKLTSRSRTGGVPVKFLQMLVVKKASQRLLPKVRQTSRGEGPSIDSTFHFEEQRGFVFFYRATKHIPE